MNSIKFKVETNTYILGLNIQNELYLIAEIPYEKTVSYKDDGQWGTWWEDDWDDSPSYSTVNKADNVNIFSFIKELKINIINLLHSSKADFFYFIPNTDIKMKLYKRIYKDLKDQFLEWDTQFINDKYFYFYKNT